MSFTVDNGLRGEVPGVTHRAAAMVRPDGNAVLSFARDDLVGSLPRVGQVVTIEERRLVIVARAAAERGLVSFACRTIEEDTADG